MRKHDWPALLRAQAQNGQTIVEFCAARGLTRSKFYAERAKQSAPTGVLPIRVEPSELHITFQLSTPVTICGSATDLAQLLRCL